MRPRFAMLLAVTSTLAASCTVGPDYHPPQTAVESAFSELDSAGFEDPTTQPGTQPSRGTSRATPAVEWWRSFNDPELTHLIDQAVRSNFDLQIATARILESRAQRNITAADLLPDLTADAGYTHAKGSKNVAIPLAGLGSTGNAAAAGAAARQPSAVAQVAGAPPQQSVSPATPPPASPFGEGGLPGVTTDLFQAGFDASWELDVFGGTRRRIEAANATLGAAIEDRRDVAVSLLAEVARNYLVLRGTQQRLSVARRNLTAQREILEITRSARHSGLITELDVNRAAAQVASTEATLPPLESQVRLSIHALSTLLALEPNALSGELQPVAGLPALPPLVPVGLPSELLRRRPDIRRAERNLAAANAQIGAATADLFPKFALTGAAGLDATRFNRVFDWESNYFLVSPTVSWPIFDAGRIASNISLQKATHQEAVVLYRKSVFLALKDVQDALVNYANEQIRNASLSQSVDQSRQAVDIAGQQYRHGLSDFLNVLDAQRTLLSAEDSLAVSNQTMLTNLVALYKALGGGWQIESP